MQLKQIIDGIDGLTLRMADGNGVDSANTAFTGLSADSRNLRAGFIFAALPGTMVAKGAAKARDGRDFIDQAVAAGASAVLVPKGSQITAHAGLLVIEADNPRKALAKMAANLAEHQPATIVAVTGTNGKSSIVTFCRQLWQTLGMNGASVGTIGITASLADGRNIDKPGALTTPDPVTLHGALAELVSDGVTHVAMEASSQGLDQYRADGAKVSAAAFTNLTRDHLDYHGTMDKYLDAKLRLFTEVLADDGVAILNRDMAEYAQIAKACQDRGQRIIDISTDPAVPAAITLKARRPLAEGQFLEIDIMGQTVSLELPLVGDFQAMNALMAFALVIAQAPDDLALRAKAIAAMERLQSVRGRLELAATLPNGAAVYVDYAHTPDGLETMLHAIRPHCHGKLHVVFGCGGDRDGGKRPQMGAIAAQQADSIIVTDDNPRSEDAATIRSAVMAGIASADLSRTQNIGGRREAIAAALKNLGAGDILVVAGKGHEQGQIIGSTVIPFDDVTEVKTLIAQMNKEGGANHAPSNNTPVDLRGDRRGPRKN